MRINNSLPKDTKSRHGDSGAEPASSEHAHGLGARQPIPTSLIWVLKGRTIGDFIMIASDIIHRTSSTDRHNALMRTEASRPLVDVLKELDSFSGQRRLADPLKAATVAFTFYAIVYGETAH